MCHYEDNSWLDLALSALESNLTIPAVKAYLNRSLQNEDWYDQSYPFFVERFQETRRCYFEENSWIERKAYVFAWITKIPHGGKFNLNTTLELYKLEKEYCEKKLYELSSKELAGIPLDYLLKLAYRVLNDGGHWISTLATSTKLLHYMCPALFPIFDKKICRVLYSQENPSYGKFKGYISALYQYLNQTENEELIEYLKVKSNIRKVSVLRLVDLTLYNISK